MKNITTIKIKYPMSNQKLDASMSSLLSDLSMKVSKLFDDHKISSEGDFLLTSEYEEDFV